MGLPSGLDFEETVGRHWNDYSRRRVHELLGQYNTKSNILVV
jgi:hypothetical protein